MYFRVPESLYVNSLTRPLNLSPYGKSKKRISYVVPAGQLIMVYHILPEAEVFSEHHGGATSRWVANVLRDDDNGTVVCASADRTWRVSAGRVITISAMHWYLRALRASRGHAPWRLRQLVCGLLFARFSAALCAGDVVYIHNRPELVYVFRKLLLGKGVGLILHMHNSHLVTYPQRIAAEAVADLTLFCSRFLEEEARERFPGLRPTAVIANGADGRLFFPANSTTETSHSAGAPTILFVGRLVPEKGVHVFIAAMRLLEQRGFRALGNIIGSPEFGRNSVTPYTRSLKTNAPQNVQFLPYASGAELAQEYRRATIFCCPSVWNEAFGMVNVEAMASGLAVVATRVGGIIDIFSSGGAILVTPDSALELADAIATLIANPSMRERLAIEGHTAFIKRFEWGEIRAQYREVLSQLLSAPTATSG